MEEMHSLQARRAAAEVGEVETVIRSESSILQVAGVHEREAMRDEDVLSRYAMAAREEVAVRKSRQLSPILDRRREVRELAQVRYRDSRLWSERMKTLIDAELERREIAEERSTQAASDDRFLAQRRGRKIKRAGMESMNLS
jgi:hypothetical protein